MHRATLDAMIRAAIEAGARISEIYAEKFDAAAKRDGTPVTRADHEAEAIIERVLAPLGLPMLGEEKVASGHVPDLGERFFVVDPLDGTKEFIKKNGEFSVNIGLVDRGKVISGIVLAPALGKIWGGSDDGAWVAEVHGIECGIPQKIAVQSATPPRFVGSRSHGHAAFNSLLREFGGTENLSVGSALKFCLVAEGAAQLYPRLTPTSEWDTAAGQAVLEAAGGTLITLSGTSLVYGKQLESFINPMFVAAVSAPLARACAAKMRALV